MAAIYTQRIPKKTHLYREQQSRCGKTLAVGGWVKGIQEFFVLALQLFCKSEIMSPKVKNTSSSYQNVLKIIQNKLCWPSLSHCTLFRFTAYFSMQSSGTGRLPIQNLREGFRSLSGQQGVLARLKHTARGVFSQLLHALPCGQLFPKAYFTAGLQTP